MLQASVSSVGTLIDTRLICSSYDVTVRYKTTDASFYWKKIQKFGLTFYFFSMTILGLFLNGFFLLVPVVISLTSKLYLLTSPTWFPLDAVFVPTSFSGWVTHSTRPRNSPLAFIDFDLNLCLFCMLVIIFNSFFFLFTTILHK